MKRYIVRMKKGETNWAALKAYFYGAWKDLPKTPKEAIKSACLGSYEETQVMVMEVNFKRVRKK